MIEAHGTGATAQRWLDVGGLADVVRRKKFAVEFGGDVGDDVGDEVGDDTGVESIVVVAHEGRVFALANVCIHRERELVKGVVLRNRLVCPGHQWAFDLETGWESVKERCQPTYTVRITADERVEVDLASRAVTCPPASVLPVQHTVE